MKKLLISKYEGVYVYQIVITFVFLLAIALLILFNFDNILNNDLYASTNEVELDRSELDIISDNLNNISSSSWNELYKSNTLRDIYRNNYIKYVSNITSDLELGNIVYNYNGSIGDKYYNLTLNEDKWFIFNNFNNDSNVEFYIVDNNMNYYLVTLNVTHNINLLDNSHEVTSYKIDNFYYSYDKTSGHLYGYKYILKEKDINYYLTININNIKLSDNNMNNFLTKLSKNIKISNIDSIDFKGFKLPTSLEHISINNNFMFDFKTDVSIIKWYNDLSKGSINISLINNISKRKYNIEETIVDNIDSIIVNKGSNGYLKYNYYGNNIYLKYNLKKHKKFNTTEGAINGIIIYLDNRMYNITFDEVSFKTQDELNNILNDMKSFIITNS